MIGNLIRAGVLAWAVVAPFDIATAATPYDGSWSLNISTQRGPCDPSYYFQVNINNGVVSHPNLVRLRGRVSSGGAVRVSVASGEKSANGSGRLRGSAGSGRWTGRSGSERCSGSWTAQKY